MNTFEGYLKELPDYAVFVFGSNTEGRHGKGAAKTAVEKFDATYGQAFGPQGNSFAIITKDLTKTEHPSVSRDKIVSQIVYFYLYAMQNSGKKFFVAYSGHGKNLNGYSNKEMAAMFSVMGVLIPDNVYFEEKFAELVDEVPWKLW